MCRSFRTFQIFHWRDRRESKKTTWVLPHLILQTIKNPYQSFFLLSRWVHSLCWMISADHLKVLPTEPTNEGKNNVHINLEAMRDAISVLFYKVLQEKQKISQFLTIRNSPVSFNHFIHVFWFHCSITFFNLLLCFCDVDVNYVCVDHLHLNRSWRVSRECL